VVVGDGERVWTCNVSPDLAVSHPVPDSAPDETASRTWAMALAAAEDDGAGAGELTWAGGVVPDGVSTVTYRFPEGSKAVAVVDGRYWVVQLLTSEDWSGTGWDFAVEVGQPPGGSLTNQVPVLRVRLQPDVAGALRQPGTTVKSSCRLRLVTARPCSSIVGR